MLGGGLIPPGGLRTFLSVGADAHIGPCKVGNTARWGDVGIAPCARELETSRTAAVSESKWAGPK